MCCRNSYPSFYISIFSTFQQDDHDKYIGAWIYFWSWVPLKRIYGSKKHVKLQRKIEKLCRCAFLVQLYTSERQALRCVFSSDYCSVFLNNYPSFYGGLTIWQAVSTFLCPFIESSLPVGQKESHSQESRKKKKSQEFPISNLTRLIKSHPSFQKSCHGELCRLTSVCTSVLSLTEVRMFMRVDQKYCEEQNTFYNISNDYIIIHHSVFCRCYISAKSSQSIF